MKKTQCDSLLRACTTTETLGLAAGRKAVSSAFALASNAVIDGFANQLKDGDVAKEKVRKMIIRDLDKISWQLECQSLKGLGASLSFLKEGLVFLKVEVKALRRDENMSPPDEAGRVSNVSEILNAVTSLCATIKESNIFSAENRLDGAKDCFKSSREEATKAFKDKSLDIRDRIMACTIRVVARLLEIPETPTMAITLCRRYIEELHALLEIQEIFLVFVEGGLLSWLGKEERLEMIMSVLSINHALFDFAFMHSSEYPNVFTWPRIEFQDCNVNPILHAREFFMTTPVNEKVLRQLSRIVIDEVILGSCFALNSRSEVFFRCSDELRVFRNAGKCESGTYHVISENLGSHSEAIAVDSNDKLCVVRYAAANDGNSNEGNLVLKVFDEDCNPLDETPLGFLSTSKFSGVRIAEYKNDNLVMIQQGDKHVYIWDSKRKSKSQFKRDGSNAYSLCMTDSNDIMIPSDDQRSVLVYTREPPPGKGHFKFAFQTPEDHKIEKVAFHHGISKVIVLTYVKDQGRNSLLCYSETGELKHSEVFNKRDLLWSMDIAGHSSGPFVARWRDSISFI